SPLDPSLSLFELGADGLLHLITANTDTGNNTRSDNGEFTPLAVDSTVYAGLLEGDYYLAVSSGFNVPLPGQAATVPDVFDPNVSHSGQIGSSIGPYFLNLLVHTDDIPPRVRSVTPSDGSILNGPPTELLVQFSEPVDLQQLAYQAIGQTPDGSLAFVYVQGSDGRRYYPRLTSFDNVTNQA